MNHRSRALNLVVASLCLWLSTSVMAVSNLGNYTSYSAEGKQVTIQAGSSFLRFVYYKPNVPFLCQEHIQGFISPMPRDSDGQV